MRIEWDPRAIQDLAEIRAYIAADNPAAATRVAERIKAALARLGEFPQLGRQSRFPNLRVLAISATPYVAYYHLLPGQVRILAVFHGARRRFRD